MTNDDLAGVIERVREGTAFENNIYIRSLLGNVALARVWFPDSSWGYPSEFGYSFYLVYSDAVCVAAFLWMGSDDLHVFVKEEFRGRGIMSNAMRNIILPHLFLTHETMTEQHAQFSAPESKRLLEQVGFAVVDETHAVFRKDQCAVVDFPTLIPKALPDKRKQELQKRFGYMAAMVEMTRFELESLDAAPQFCENLEYLRSQLRDHVTDMEDVQWDQNKRLG